MTTKRYISHQKARSLVGAIGFKRVKQGAAWPVCINSSYATHSLIRTELGYYLRPLQRNEP